MRLAKQPLVILASVLVLFAAVHANAQPERAKHSLWKVQGKTNTVYLFGSIHFLKDNFYPLPEPIESAYKGSGVVVFEADLAETDAAQEKVIRAGMLPFGEKLSDHVSGESYALLQSYLRERLGIATAFDQFRPWLAAVSLLTIELSKLGYDPQQGVDRYFFNKARRDKKRVDAFETIDFQVGIFTGLTKTEQEQMLKESVHEITRFKSVVSDIVNAWRTGDATALDKLIVAEMRGYPDLHKKLLLDRNKQWVTKILEHLARREDVFVVVGAAHLVGTDSIVGLLQQRGYRAEQL